MVYAIYIVVPRMLIWYCFGFVVKFDEALVTSYTSLIILLCVYISVQSLRVCRSERWSIFWVGVT